MTANFAQRSLEILIVGIGATAVLDLWALALNRLFGLPKTNWAHVGRWVAGLPAGTLRHDSIVAAPAVDHEALIGWTTHYVIGVIYAAAWLLLLAAIAATPSLTSAVAFGIATVVAPWLVLQPGLGAGYFASKTPKPARTRILNLLSHTVFGVGLYLTWSAMTRL